MTGDEARDHLAAALCTIDQQQNDMGGEFVRWEHAGADRKMRHLDQADALLPVVRKIAADELRAAATDLEWAADKQDRPDVALGFRAAAARIRERLDADQ